MLALALVAYAGLHRAGPGARRDSERCTRIAVDPEHSLPPSPTVGGTNEAARLRLVLAAEAEASAPCVDIFGQLRAAGFRPLTPRDVALCRALNAGYLLRLSLEPQLTELEQTRACTEEDASPGLAYDGRVSVYVRGHGTNVVRGAFFGPKIAYLQASAMRRLLRPLALAVPRAERWLVVVLRRMALSLRRSANQMHRRIWPHGSAQTWRRRTRRAASAVTDGVLSRAPLTDGVLTRYSGGFVQYTEDNPLTPFVLPPERDDRLVDALAAAATRPSSNASGVASGGESGGESGGVSDDAGAAPYVERVAIADIFESRSAWRRRRFRFGAAAARRLLAVGAAVATASELVEPTFGQVVVAWRRPANNAVATGTGTGTGAGAGTGTASTTAAATTTGAGAATTIATGTGTGARSPLSVSPLELRSYRNVPMANTEALLPRTRLVFRPADALRLDLISLVSVASALATARFTAVSARLVTAVALTVAVLRSILAYANALARYELQTTSFCVNHLAATGDEVRRSVARTAAEERARVASMLFRWLCTQPTPATPKMIEAAHNAMVREWLADANAPAVAIDLRGAMADLVRLGLARASADGALVAAGGAPAVDGGAFHEHDVSATLEAHMRRLLQLQPDRGQRPARL